MRKLPALIITLALGAMLTGCPDEAAKVACDTAKGSLATAHRLLDVASAVASAAQENVDQLAAALAEIEAPERFGEAWEKLLAALNAASDKLEAALAHKQRAEALLAIADGLVGQWCRGEQPLTRSELSQDGLDEHLHQLEAELLVP